MSAVTGNKKRWRQPSSHRWMIDYSRADYKPLDKAAREWLRRFHMEYYFNTREADPEQQIHRDFVRDGKVVKAMAEEGYGVYKAYSEAERDLYAKLVTASPKCFLGFLVNVDAEVERSAMVAESEPDASDFYPPTESHEEDVITKVDLEREAKSLGMKLDYEEAGTSPMELSVEVQRRGQKPVTVWGTTYLNGRGVIVRNVRADEKIWPDDREAATKLLHALRVQIIEESRKHSSKKETRNGNDSNRSV